MYIVAVAVLLVPIVWIAASCYLSKDQKPREDEIYWIGSAYYFHLAFVEHDLTHPDWRLLPARENPPLGKYLIGASLRLLGEHISSPRPSGLLLPAFRARSPHWGAGEDFDKRAQVASRVDPVVAATLFERGEIPLGRRTLMIARALMGALAIVTVGAIVMIGRLCNSLAGGFIASFIFAIHPVVAAAYRTAMVDIAAICFSALCMLGYIAILQQIWKHASRPRLIQGALVLSTGLMLACACGTKMNALIVAAVGVFVVGFQAVRWYRTRSSEDARAVMLLLSAAAIALATFLVVNPAL